MKPMPARGLRKWFAPNVVIWVGWATILLVLVLALIRPSYRVGSMEVSSNAIALVGMLLVAAHILAALTVQGTDELVLAVRRKGRGHMVTAVAMLGSVLFMLLCFLSMFVGDR